MPLGFSVHARGGDERVLRRCLSIRLPFNGPKGLRDAGLFRAKDCGRNKKRGFSFKKGRKQPVCGFMIDEQVGNV
jgi:hypothetical protein